VHIGQKAAREWGLDDLLPYFSLSEAMNLYGQKQYSKAAQKLNGILPIFAAGNDKANLALSSFFIAKCYWQVGKATQALPHLKKIDEIFNEKKYIRPDLLQGYEMLIDHYKSTGNTKLALHYMGRLLAASKVVDRDYKYLSGKVLRKYNTRELQQQMQETLNQSYNQKIYGSILIALLCAALAAVIYRHQRQRKEYSEKFKEWVKKKKQLASKDIPVPVGYSESQLGFSEELAERLVKRLELFEKRHEYIEPYMNLQKLAAKLNTNQKYVTRLLAHYRGKGTIEYISDLKIEYIVQKLQSEKKLRNYKNKSLSDEVGFGSTQIFTRTFKAKVGMPPTVFIDELNKADQMS